MTTKTPVRKGARPDRHESGSGWTDTFLRMWGDVPDTFMTLAKPVVRVEEFVEDDTFVVRAEMPGVDPDKDVTVTTDDGVLMIDATRSEHTETRNKDRYRSEFHYGTFSRRLRLPSTAKASEITATYNDGILEVRVPLVPKPAEPTRVEVTRG